MVREDECGIYSLLTCSLLFQAVLAKCGEGVVVGDVVVFVVVCDGGLGW